MFKECIKYDFVNNFGNCLKNALTNDFVITDGLVTRTIGEFKEHKSPGIDGIISTYAIKTKEMVARPLSLLFNRMTDDCNLPSVWRKANITPMFLKGDRSSVENYSPVSLIPFFGKVYEMFFKNDIK